jgi:hypothetical protein
LRWPRGWWNFTGAKSGSKAKAKGVRFASSPPATRQNVNEWSFPLAIYRFVANFIKVFQEITDLIIDFSLLGWSFYLIFWINIRGIKNSRLSLRIGESWSEIIIV